MAGRAYISTRYGDERYEEPYGMTLAQLAAFVEDARAKGIPESSEVRTFPEVSPLHQIALLYSKD